MKRVQNIIIRKFGKPGMNALLLGISDTFCKLVLFVILVFYARSFGVLAYGHFSFAFSLCAILVAISDPGINQFIIREIASQRQRTISSLRKLFWMKILLGFPFIFATILYCGLAGVRDTPFILSLLMAFYFWIDTLHQFMRNIVRAKERMELDLVSRVSERSVLFIAVTLTIVLGKSPILTAACFPLVALLSMSLDLWLVRPFALISEFSTSSLGRREIVRQILPFTLSHIVFLLYFRVDILMLQLLRGFESVGIYIAAYRVFEGVQIIPVAFAGSLYPVFSRLRSGNDMRLPGIVRQVALILIPLGIVLLLLLLFFSDMITNALYGQSYADAGKILSVLTLGIPFTFFYLVFTYLLAAFDKQGLVVVYGLVLLLVNIGANLILIPMYGPTGAAASTVLCEVIFALIMLVITRKLLKGFKREGAASFNGSPWAESLSSNDKGGKL